VFVYRMLIASSSSRMVSKPFLGSESWRYGRLSAGGACFREAVASACSSVEILNRKAWKSTKGSYGSQE
jgi:hypothetical protein